MALLSFSGVKINGIAAAVPSRVKYTKDYDLISEKEQENLVRMVGVEQRRVADEGTATSDLCQAASEKLIQGLGWDRNEIDLLVFISQSRDYIIPATAGILQDKLGLSKSCLAFDISLGCSGYVYGLSVMGSMMANGQLRKGLLLVGDVSTKNTSYKDKSTYPLFGDAGTATALSYGSEAGTMAFNLQTDGAGYEAIIIPDGGIRNFASPDTSFQYEKIDEGIERNKLHIALDGIEVFNFSLREVAPNVKALLADQGREIGDIDFYVMHQANRLMNETIRKQLKIAPEKYPYSIAEFGNTSSASIPLTMAYRIREELQKLHLHLLLSGFGVGLSWGSAIIETDKIYCPEIIEYKS